MAHDTERLVGMAQKWDLSAGEDGAAGYAEFFAEVIATHRENFAILSALGEPASYDPTVRDFYAADLEEFDEAVHKTLA